MSNEKGAEVTGRVALEDIIEAASQGALRALEARNGAPQSGQGFYCNLHIICGIPPYIDARLVAQPQQPVQGALEP
jgi:hypothetical protein